MKVNQLKTGAILTYVSLIIGYIISIAYTPAMLRLLGQSEYGLYNLVASVVSYLGLLNFGFGSAYVRFYSRYKVEEDMKNIAKLNGMFLIIFSVIGIVAIIAGGILTLNTGIIFGSKLTEGEVGTATLLMVIMVINIAISFPNLVFNSYITANEKFVFQKLLQLIKTVANPFLILPILLMGYGSVGMVIGTTLLNVLVEIAHIRFCFKKLNMKFSFHDFDFPLMKEMTIFSSYLFIYMIIDQVNWNVDKFILGRFHGTVAVALYGLAAQINNYYLSLSVAISNVFIPRVNRMVAAGESNDTLSELFIRVGRLQFILLSLVLSGFVFFGMPFINMWAGKQYSQCYYIILVLIVPVTVAIMQNIGIEIQKAKNMHKFRAWVYLLIAVGNVFISIPLAKAYEGIGAALGTAIALVLGNIILMNWYYQCRVGINIKKFWGEIFRFIPALIIPVCSGVILVKLFDFNNFSLFVFGIIIYSLIFGISMWLFGMNTYEKNLISKPLKKVVSLMK